MTIRLVLSYLGFPMAEFRIPELGENIDKGDVVKVNVAVGDTVALNQTVLELETDKAVVEVPSSVAGKVTQIFVKVGDKVKKGHVVFVVDGDASSKSEPRVRPSVVAESVRPPVVEQPVRPSPPSQNTGTGLIVAASPSVRRLAREIGVDITQVTGSGSGARVTEDDVKSFARKLNTGRAEREQSPDVPRIKLPDFSKWGMIDKKPMTAVRRKTANHLSQAWFVPHVTQCDKADITELEKIRKNSPVKPTLTVIVLKIVANALKVFPQFNASVDMTTDEVIFKKYYNIGVAVDTDRGLLVPVVRDVEKKSIAELSVELSRLAQAARDKKLVLDDMQGGTFTITNLGGFGGTYFTPIVNAPEVAILGLSRGQIEPIYVDGKFEPRLMLPLSLSYDHRLIDGADAIRFLRWICEAMASHFLLDL